MSDLIRRQDVLAYPIRADHYDREHGNKHFIAGIESVMEYVECLPSAEKTQLSGEDATKDATSDLISKKEAVDAILGLTNCDTVEELRAYVIEHDLGSWWSGGVLSSVGKVERLPSAQPEIIRCGQCKYAEAADSEDNQDGYTCQFHRGSIWFSGSYCSWAERREECTP